MRLFLLAGGLSITVASWTQQPHVTEDEAVGYAKAVDVHILDPSLPSQRLEDWLKAGPPHVDVLWWRLEDTCDVHPDLSDSDYPSCVRVSFARGGQEGFFLILEGTLKNGIIGPPQLYYAIDVTEPGFVQTGSADRLSGLPHLLDQPAVTVSVSDFYQKIVAIHPMGIPQSKDKTALWPYLSRRLTQQLETAQACQDDYLRREATAGNTPRPAWMTSDLFAGENQLTAPFFVNIVHKEPLKDGFFAVQLDAVERDVTGKNSSIIAGGVRAYRVKKDWPIIATVVLENKRFVVDDVRIFEEDTTDGPSHLLSETFAGSDGLHWTGEHVEKKLVVAHASPPIVDWDAVNVLRSAAYKEEVAFAKDVDVHQLDPLLPSQHLQNWLNSASVRANHVEWDAEQCNIKEGANGATPNPEGGLCAGVWFRRGNARAVIRVGKSVSDVPKTKFIGVSDKDEDLLRPLSGNEKASDSELLSDLPRLLNEESVIDVTRKLYDAVVEGHPLGIPQGINKTRIGPLLSKRLKELLETAQICHEDCRRQVAVSTAEPKRPWPKVGLFSGENELALPTASLVDYKTRQSDDSFLVFVWLSHKAGPAELRSPVSPLWRIWHVATKVIREDGRFVVDDVRLFDGDSAMGPSHLLSESFAGCNGSHWVGTAARTAPR